MKRLTELWSYVLSIGKLGKGQEGYYLDAVARGAEDYYLGGGESPGRWCGSGATELGLDGEVRDDDLRVVLQGEHPMSGRRLVRRSRTLPGFDCTFSAPKSVSVVHALGDAEQRAAIAIAHDAAVDAALGYLERQAAIGRRGRDGVHRIATSGFAAAAFRHRTSRAQDPQLHTHVLVANMVKGPDGRWGAIFGRLVYAHKMDAGAVYQAHLRAELTERLGVEWHTPRNGLAELQGVPVEVLRAFSQRRTQIEAALAARGESSAAAAATATLTTRTTKRDVDAGTLISEWRERAEQLGFGAEELAAVTGRKATNERWLRPDQAADELTAHASYFDRRHAVRVYASSARAGLRVEELERRVDRCLADAGVVTLEPDPLVGPRYTTRELLRAEKSLLERVERGRDRGVAVADQHAVDAAVA